ncbi:LPXTG cell wall anchor domain-containing protein [Trueperella pecoris]|uniref:LPXTG cell wall anchor domain-containing protein n=1 Tax=Trueperella pecoris TaxID=2733571 RepID=A0A7M1R2F1_9ACTO|nr:DUF11 domain-containing protein [Trueperella pecoris]QOR47647.1 LPXTG cell wall anchor domain-containing protein [Trueperella pecoris]
MLSRVNRLMSAVAVATLAVCLTVGALPALSILPNASAANVSPTAPATASAAPADSDFTSSTVAARTEGNVVDDSTLAHNKVVLELDKAMVIDGVVAIERTEPGKEFLGHSSVLVKGGEVSAEAVASAPVMDKRGVRIAVKLPDGWATGDKLELGYNTYGRDAGVEWKTINDGAQVFVLRDDVSNAVEVIDPTVLSNGSIVTKADKVLTPSSADKVADIYFVAPANINATKIKIKRTTIYDLYSPPTSKFNGDTPNIKVAEFKGMYDKKYQPLWDDIRRKEATVLRIDNKTVEISIPQGMTMEKGEYVKITNAFSYRTPGAPYPESLQITVTGQTQAGGFCEDRARYTFPARALHTNRNLNLTAIMQEADGNLVNRDNRTEEFGRGKSLKEIAELQGNNDPKRVFYAPWHDEYKTPDIYSKHNDELLKEYVLRNVPYYGPDRKLGDGSKVVSRQGKRELTDEERRNGINVYVNESKPNGQIRWKSYIARQDNGTGQFHRLGGPNAETGWIVNALAFNPKDNWLYGISQGRLGEDWGRLPGQVIQGHATDYHGRVVVTAEDPCFPSGHLLQINPATGEIHNLGRLTSPTDQFKTGYAFQGQKQTYWPNDLWGGINVGGIDTEGNYYVANASLSGSGAVYKVNLENVTAEVTANANKWLRTPAIRYKDDWNSVSDRSGRAWSEDWTPLFVPEKTECKPDTGTPCKQRQAGNYMWGISNGWNSQGRVYIERISADDGNLQRWDVTALRTYAGQSLPVGNQWGRAWSFGNSILGFATSSSGATDKVVRIKVTNPESDNPSFKLMSVNANAQPSYNSNGTSAVNFEENIVDLKLKKSRKDFVDTDGVNRVQWDLEVKNASESAASSGFTVFDTIPASYRVVRVQAEGKVFNANSSTSIVGPWSVYLKKGDQGHDVLEGSHGALQAGKTVKLTIIAEPRSGQNLPIECIENVAGVIGIDRDPSTVNANEFGKTMEGGIDKYGDWLKLNGGIFGDLVSDQQCRPTIVVKKQIVEDGKITDEAAGGWAFSAQSDKDNLDLEGQEGFGKESTKVTSSEGVEKGTVIWRPKENGQFNLTITEKMTDEQTAAGYAIRPQENGGDARNAICKLTVKDGKKLAQPEMVEVEDHAGAPGFAFSFGDKTMFPDGMNVKTEQRVECTVQNEITNNHIFVRKEAYDPQQSDKIGTLPDLAGAEFAVYELSESISAKSWEEWQNYIVKAGDGSVKKPVEIKDYRTPIPVKVGKSYIVVETKAPTDGDGRPYSLRPAPIPFTVTTAHGEDATNKRPFSIQMENDLLATASWKVENGNSQKVGMYLTVADVHTGTLPRTGGAGVAWLGGIGGLLVLAGLTWPQRKQRS